MLLDTSILIYTDSGKLPLKIQTLLSDTSSRKFISSISIWEILQKARINKLPVHFTKPEFIKGIIEDLDATLLEFTGEDAFTITKLPPIHKDPFDRMLICQAINNGLAIVTDDMEIHKYSIKTIW